MIKVCKEYDRLSTYRENALLLAANTRGWEDYVEASKIYDAADRAVYRMGKVKDWLMKL